MQTAELSNRGERLRFRVSLVSSLQARIFVCCLFSTAHALLNSRCNFVYNQVIMHNETAVKLLVCYVTRLAFTVLRLATGGSHCKSDRSAGLVKLTLLKLGFYFRFNLQAPRVLCIGQAFRYTPENALYIYIYIYIYIINTYFII